ncbi:MAG TPA: YggS family pyridoxal phosphate-dependent enzyme [Nocardioides sp.]|nr:YggS family pyridoxal phosphate-dependent enzyme [Nocardioides sp.]
MSRREELAAGLEQTRTRIAAAVAGAGREPGSVDLVVVTKFFPASDVRLLEDLGVTDVGENRHQEADAKAAECVDLGLTWHFIGGLQTNKAAAVARYAGVVESVDRIELIPRLARGAAEAGRELAVLLQVSLEPGAGGRSGAAPADLDRLAEAATQAGLDVRGLMAVAPLGEDPAAAFGRLAEVRAEFLRDRPTATVLSAGMSGDLEQAIAAGATHVRVGSAILGSRSSVK